MRSVVLKIINILSQKILAKYDPIIIGITGSTGKSSSKKAIYDILKTKYKVVCNKSVYRTDVSIPLAIIGLESGGRSVRKWTGIINKAIKMLNHGVEYPDVLILEMGVDRPNDMKKMLKLTKPDIAVMTGVGEFPSHTAYFKNASHIAREKSLLAKSIGKKGLTVLNLDDEYTKNLLPNLRSETITYGFNEGADLKAEEIFLGERKWKIENGSMGMSFKISYKGTTIPFRLPYVLGRGQIYAVLSAAAIGIHFGFNLLEISEILSRYQPLAGRMKLVKGMKKSLIIDDTFNANPCSMLAALETLRNLDSGRRIAVLGEMKELGEYSAEGHAKVGKQVPKSADLLFVYGAEAKIIYDQAKKSGLKEGASFYFNDMRKLIESLKSIIQEGDAILVKGSRAMRMEKIVKEIMAEPEKAGELLVRSK